MIERRDSNRLGTQNTQPANNTNNNSHKQIVSISRPGYDVKLVSKKKGYVKLHAGHMKHTFNTCGRSGVSFIISFHFIWLCTNSLINYYYLLFPCSDFTSFETLTNTHNLYNYVPCRWFMYSKVKWRLNATQHIGNWAKTMLLNCVQVSWIQAFVYFCFFNLQTNWRFSFLFVSLFICRLRLLC